MAKVKIEFSPETTGVQIQDLIWDWCKTIDKSENVLTSLSTLTERGLGVYILSNPNITKDTDFRLHLVSDVNEYVTGIFSPSDGDIARESVLENIITMSNNNKVRVNYGSEEQNKNTVTFYKNGSKINIGDK